MCVRGVTSALSYPLLLQSEFLAEELEYSFDFEYMLGHCMH